MYHLGFFSSFCVYRVCLIEPAVVNTGMLVEVGNQLSAALRIDTTEDLDRQQIAFWVNARSLFTQSHPGGYRGRHRDKMH